MTAINMSLDGYCDHTGMVADDNLHRHFNEIMRNAGTLLYGRKTYQLMEEYWPLLVAKPSGEKAMDDFALLIDDIEKVVWSRTLASVSWKNSRLAADSLRQELDLIKTKPGKDILIGSPSLISEALKERLADEYHFCVHPVLAGEGLRLFDQVSFRSGLRLAENKTLPSGVVALTYKRE